MKMGRIIFCLAATCFFAAVTLGFFFRLTEPAKRANQTAMEHRLVQKLLELDANAKVVEVRRYLGSGEDPFIGYLLSNALQIYNTAGELKQSIPIPAALAQSSGEEQDQWVAKEFTGSQKVGRFFVAWTDKQELAGYVTEGTKEGFKSLIRFFVALTPDFQIRGVEVVSHEEDPGLGAEIAKSFFKNQFAGRSYEQSQTMSVTKDSMPTARQSVVLARDDIPFLPWLSSHANLITEGNEPIYAVTGATISSRALTDGVKKAVAHLKHRLEIVMPQKEGRHE